MEAEEEEIVAEIVVEILAVMAVDAASVVTVVNATTVVIVVVQEADTKKVTEGQMTGQHTKVAETADPIQAVQHVRIRTEVAAGLMQAKNPGTRNKPEIPGKRKRGSRKLKSGKPLISHTPNKKNALFPGRFLLLGLIF
jgi:hypothetical protein